MIKKILFTLILILATTSKTFADLYTITDIPISAEAETVLAAKEMAIRNGEIDAFWRLMKRMVNESDLESIPMLEEENVDNLVQTVSISNEKTAFTKYIATLSVRFKAKEIQNLFIQNKIPFLTQTPPKTLLIPILKKGDQVLVFEEDNPAFIYLKDHLKTDSLLEVVIPEGNAEEKTLAHTILASNDPEGWTLLAHKYNLERILVLDIAQKGPYITVDTAIISSKRGILPGSIFDFTVPSGDILEVLPEMWQKVLEDQDKNWRLKKTNDLSSATTFWTTVPVKDLKEWAAMEAKLKEAKFLDGYSLRGFRPKEMLVTLSYKGGDEQLNKELYALGLTLQETFQDDLLILKSISKEDME